MTEIPAQPNRPPYGGPPTPAYAHAIRPHTPRLLVDLEAISTRYRAVLTTPTDGFRTALVGSVADIPALTSEVDRLYVLLRQVRRQYADLAAAARATLAAHAEGEPDPLAYLRDELGHSSTPWTDR